MDFVEVGLVLREKQHYKFPASFSGFDQQPRGHILLWPSWWLCCCCCCRLFVLYGDKLLFTLQATLEANQPSHCRCDFVFLHLALVKWKENGEEVTKKHMNYLFFLMSLYLHILLYLFHEPKFCVSGFAFMLLVVTVCARACLCVSMSVCVRQQVFCVTTHHPSSQMGEWQGEQKQTPCSGKNKRLMPTNDKCLLFVCVSMCLCASTCILYSCFGSERKGWSKQVWMGLIVLIVSLSGHRQELQWTCRVNNSTVTEDSAQSLLPHL